jgi:glyoxylase-like metal-dependent hydrolase (beta-lactamase superfamily II)
VKATTGASMGIGEHIRQVQRIFGPVFNATDLRMDGSDFDSLFVDGDAFRIGELTVEVLYVPGHTPADIAYKVGDAVFVGDTLFMPDYGAARTDFPGGDARIMFRSIQRILSLPPETRLFMCHDYKAPGRDHFAWETTVEAERNNVHLRNGVDEDAFAAMRSARDATLAAPALLLPAIQVSMRAGRFPPAAANGARYLHLPVQLKSGAAGCV